MKHAPLAYAAALMLAACASHDAGWTSREGAEPYNTARTACTQISYGSEANFITCMAGRGWVKPKR